MRNDLSAPPTTTRGTETVTRLGTAGLLALLLAASLSFLSYFSVTVALADLARDLGATSSQLQLVIAGYGIPLAGLVVVSGRLGDRVGRRRLLVAGLVGVAVTSAAGAAASEPWQLITARVLQGVSAAGVTPHVLATIQATSDGSARRRALALYGATGGVATSLSFLLGGSLLQADPAGLGWRVVFAVNVPIALAAVVAVLRWAPATRSSSPTPVDLLGAGLLGTLMVLLVGGLTEGRATGWPAWSWALLVGAVVVGAAFWTSQRRRERSGRAPLVPPTMLAVPAVRWGLLLAVLFFAGFGGFMFVIALLADLAGLSAIGTGLMLLPLGLSFLVGSLASSWWDGLGATRLIVTGSLMSTTGYLLVALGVALGWPTLDSGAGAVVVTVGMLVAGFGQGLVLAPLFGQLLAAMPARVAGLGSGVLVTTQQGGLALGAATIGSLFLAVVPLGVPGAFALTVLAQVATLLALALFAPRLVAASDEDEAPQHISADRRLDRR